MRIHDNTSITLARVVEARKRVLVMEYIKGGRVDDLKYLSDNDIDRNKVALEISRIFSQMVHLNGWFHAVSSSYLWFCNPVYSKNVARTHTLAICSFVRLRHRHDHHTTLKLFYLTMAFILTSKMN